MSKVHQFVVSVEAPDNMTSEAVAQELDNTLDEYLTEGLTVREIKQTTTDR